MSGEDDNETRFLLYKVWCHGQSLAPPLLGVLCFFSSSISTLEAVSVMILLSIWPVVSWKAMQRPNLHRVVVGGLVVELIYSYILAVTPARNASTFELLLFIATVLLMVETFAYLLVMFWNRAWFIQSLSPLSRMMVTTDDGFIDRIQVV
mmetsp:Transcript_18823/g.34051  ORF Transcript_18823/g.34051 Transcript_18823/m.34051 type:complete len:150 (-) Transcript_18823:341-790(-)